MKELNKKTNHEKQKEEIKNLSREERETLDKKKKIQRIWIAVILAVIGIAVLAAVLWKLSGAGNAPSEKVVFKVGGEAVYLDEVNLCIYQNVMNLGMTADSLNTTAEDGSSADDYYKKEILQMIMDYKVEAKVARMRGMTLSDEEKKEIRNDVVEYMGEADGRMLRKFGITQERIIEIFEERYLANGLEQTVTQTVTVEEQNYCTMYMLLFPKVEMDENGDYVREEDGETPVMLSDADIEKRKSDADAAHQELLDGEEIERVAEKYEVAAFSGEESNLAGSFGEPFTEYAEKLKEGEYSPVLETESCYAILKMVTENNEEIANQILSYYKADLEEETVEKNKKAWYEEAGVSEEAEFVGSAWNLISLYDFVQ